MAGTRKKSIRRLARLIASSANPVAGGTDALPRGQVFEEGGDPHTFAQSGLQIDTVAERLAEAFEPPGPDDVIRLKKREN